MEDLGKFLDFFRRSQGLSQADVANKTGIARSHLCEMYSGKKAILSKHLAAIAKVHRLKVWEIIWAVEDGSSPAPSDRIKRLLDVCKEML